MTDPAETTTAPPDAPVDTTHAQLTALQADNASLAKQNGESQAALAQVIRERDALKASIGELEPRAKQADELKVRLEGLTNASREAALVEKLRAQLPGADPLVIRGTLATLAEQGRAQRYPEKAEDEAAKILDIIKKEAPGLTRPATGAGGSSLVRAADGKQAYRGPLSQ